MIDQISYVLTVYNKADFLPEVLAAVAAECAATGGEIIIVDDGSTDESPDLLAEFAVENAAARVLRQANQGVAAATNAGIEAATGKFIRLIDGDDVPVPGSTALLLSALDKTGVGFAYGRQVFAIATQKPFVSKQNPGKSLFRLRERATRLSPRSPQGAEGLVAVGEGQPADSSNSSAGPLTLPRLKALTGLRRGSPLPPAGEGTKDVCLISDPLRLMLTNQPFIPSVTLGRREVMQACLPLPTRYRTAQDFALGLALAPRARFVAIDTTCCLSPPQPGLSSSKARMFQDTARLCLDYGQDWPRRYCNLALQRNAGRARNYLRRHLPGEKAAIRRVSLMAALAKLPLPWPFTRWLTYIAATYQPAVADHRNHA